MLRTGNWNGKRATVLRRDGDKIVIQVEDGTTRSGASYEHVKTVTAAQWAVANGLTYPPLLKRQAANPSKESK